MSTDALPVFARLAGHPLRWRLLTALSDSDLRVRELTAQVEEPQNLVSYHLRLLREGGLVSARRSSADGRDAYYHLDIEHCRELLSATGTSLHPALGAPSSRGVSPRRRVRVLFLCTGNSGRSPMAAALLAQAGGEGVEAVSAGSHPKPISPDAVRQMRSHGIDLAAHRPTHLEELAGQRFHYVITLCDKVREVCPELPGHPRAIHWSLPDPNATDAADKAVAYAATAADLQSRISSLLAVIGVRAVGTRDMGGGDR